MTLREAQVTLSTYPFARFLRIEQDPVTGQPAQVLDWAAYEASSPRPAPVAYQAVILENAFLRLTLLPDLGGRIYECVFKPTGNNELYGNPVVKPTHWGPPHPPYPAGSNWWPAAGGIEWGFPVEEHGFVFGTKWAYDHTEGEDGSITVGLFSSAATRPYVTIDVTLAPNSASFLVEPSITNPGDEPFRFKFWANAMLAPGKANAPGPDLRLLFPGREVLVHSSGDPALPAPGQRMSWPLYGGRDMSRLGTWSSYLGFFAPAPVAWSGVYDTAADEGMLRVSGSGPARGAKAFAAGWSNPLPSTEWTDDRSGYVELHSGLMPDFEQWYELPPGERVTWGETWYPAARVGGVVAASEHGALNLRSTPAGMRFDFMPVRPGTYRIELSAAPGDPNQSAAEGQAAPGQPFTGTLPAPAGANPTARILDATGRELLTYRP